MKFYVDDELVYELTDDMKKVIMNDIEEELFVADMKRRVKYIIEHKYQRCLSRLKDEWMPKLKDMGVTKIPVDDEELSRVFTRHPKFKNKSARMREVSAQKQARKDEFMKKLK